MTDLAIIGGSGLQMLSGLDIIRKQEQPTPYGEPSGPLVHGRFHGKEIIFLARHGERHTIAPHKVNYRANVWALKKIGVERIVGIAAVGGISKEMRPSRLAFPRQVIDYTWSRNHTFFDNGNGVTHMDFSEPYCSVLRELLIRAAAKAKLDACGHGVYGATQGPRLETAAEIDRLERDGCTMVGMTGMPETALARELGLSYASCAVVANWAAGRGEGAISMDEIESNLKVGMEQVTKLLGALIPLV